MTIISVWYSEDGSLILPSGTYEVNMERHQFDHDLPQGLERELLTILAEECNEIGIRASKAMRFGLHEIQPGQDYDNVQRLSLEVGDLLEVIDRLQILGCVDQEYIELGKSHKKKQLSKFLKHQDQNNETD